jgi:hypothetical protein
MASLTTIHQRPQSAIKVDASKRENVIIKPKTKDMDETDKLQENLRTQVREAERLRRELAETKKVHDSTREELVSTRIQLAKLEETNWKLKEINKSVTENASGLSKKLSEKPDHSKTAWEDKIKVEIAKNEKMSMQLAQAITKAEHEKTLQMLKDKHEDVVQRLNEWCERRIKSADTKTSGEAEFNLKRFKVADEERQTAQRKLAECEKKLAAAETHAKKLTECEKKLAVAETHGKKLIEVEEKHVDAVKKLAIAEEKHADCARRLADATKRLAVAENAEKVALKLKDAESRNREERETTERLKDQLAVKTTSVERAHEMMTSIDKLLEICQKITQSHDPSLTPHLKESQAMIRSLRASMEVRTC